MDKDYTTIPVLRDTFNEMYMLKATLLRGTKDKSWDHFMRKVAEIVRDYIDIYK